MTRRRIFIWIITIIFFVILSPEIFAEPITDQEFGFSLDIPEGFEIADYTEDGMSYLFTHPNIPVTFALKVISNPEINSASQALSSSLTKLKAKTQVDNFVWNNSNCAISNFSMTLDKKYAGWATAAPTLNYDSYVVLICYAPQDKEKGCEQFIMSTLNSLCTNEMYYNTPGIITTYAFPKEGTKNIQININGRKVLSTIDKSDIEAAQFVVDMEYSVLTLYAKHKAWKEAWQRYYRMIYRDSFSRLQNVSSNLYDSLYEDCRISNPSNPDIAYAQLLLTWTQNFEYERAKDKKQSDFTCLPAAVCGNGSDCDSRSLLLCVLLKSIGIETLFLFSPEYSHAVAATAIDAPGQKYLLENDYTEYIFGETTAKVTWGMIAQEHSDRKKWIPVILP